MAPLEPLEPDIDTSEATRELGVPVSVLTEFERQRRRQERRHRRLRLPSARATQIRLALAAPLTGLLVFLLLTGGGEERSTAPKPQGVAGALHAPAAALPRSLDLSKAGVLKKGSKGKEVRELQRVLAVLGFSPGKVDGVYGERTRNAVAAFQLAYRLKPNGAVGRKTARMLNRVLAELADDGVLPAAAS